MATRMLRCFLVLALVGTALPASAVVVDDFSNNHATITDPPGGATSVAAAAAVGGRRGLLVKLRQGPGPVSGGVSGGTLNFSVAGTTPDSRGEAVVTWDGDSDPNVLSFLGTPLDLETPGHRSFRIRVNSASAGTEIVLEVYTDASNSSVAALRLPAVASTDFYLSYGPGADFVTRLGTGADFAQVRAIVMAVRGTETAASIDFVDTVAPNVAAIKRDVELVGVNVPITTPQAPGATFKYRVTITNTGGEAVRVDFNDDNDPPGPNDPNIALDPSTADASVLAVRDAYRTFGNVPITVTAGANLYDCIPSNSVGLLNNDCDADAIDEAPPDPTELVITTVGAIATTLGGTATVLADGSFTYTPPSGVAHAVDTFTYMVQDDDGNPPAPATVTINIGRRIWFVDDDANVTGGIDGTGRFGDPYDQFTPLSGAGGIGDVDEAGDLIFVYSGNHSGGIELEADQELVGQGDGLMLDVVPPIPVGLHPVLTNAAGNGILLSTNNVIRGLTVGNTTGVDVMGSNFGTLTATNVTLNGNGGALNLTNGALAPTTTFNSIASTNATGRGINLDTVTGTLMVTGGTTVTDSAQAGIRVTNGGSTYNFGATTLTSVASGLDLTTNATSMFNFSSLAVTTDAGTGLLANNSGTLNIGGAGNTIVATGGAAVDITSTSLGSGATFTTVSSSGSPGKGINLDTVTGNFIANGGSITTAAGIDFDVNAGASTITYAGSITNTANRSVEVTGRTGGTVTLSGNISDTGTGTGINIANNNASGTPIINFSGSTKTLNTGPNAAVTLDNNDVAQINFTGGGLDIDTTSGIGFNAINGAAGITVQGAVNTITSTTGTALNVVSSMIGGAGLTFQSISAGTGAGSGGVGISVIGSGLAAGNGGLTITGTGSAGSGGTIQHKTGADGSTTAGIGIYLQDTKNTDLAWLQLNDFDNSAIVGRNVQGFELTNSVVNGVIGTSSAAIEGPIVFGLTSPAPTNGLQGTGLIRNTKISGAIEHNLEFYNQSGSMNLTIDGTVAVSEGANPNSPADDVADCIIEENSAVSGADGIQIEMTSSATATIVIDRCLFRDNRSQAIQISALNDSVVAATIDESRTRRFDQGNEGFLLQNASNADLTAVISNNHVNNYGGTGIFVGQVAGNASASSTLHASILNNTVNQPIAATNHGILAFLTSTVGQISQARVRIDGNTVVNNSTAGTVRGILVDTPDASTTPAFHATVTNNSVAVGDNVGGVAGLVVQSRQGSDLCANIGSNTVTFPNGTPGGVLGIRARQANTATYDLEGSGACSGTPAAVLGCRNPASTTEVLGTLTVVPAGTCLLPTVP